jgi:hypothetical protein
LRHLVLAMARANTKFPPSAPRLGAGDGFFVLETKNPESRGHRIWDGGNFVVGV